MLGVRNEFDVRDLLISQATDNRAAAAVELFCYQVRKGIGVYAAVLDGVDTLVFSGGVGENAPEIRARICAWLNFLGLPLTTIVTGPMPRHHLDQHQPRDRPRNPDGRGAGDGRHDIHLLN